VRTTEPSLGERGGTSTLLKLADVSSRRKLIALAVCLGSSAALAEGLLVESVRTTAGDVGGKCKEGEGDLGVRGTVVMATTVARCLDGLLSAPSTSRGVLLATWTVARCLEGLLSGPSNNLGVLMATCKVPARLGGLLSPESGISNSLGMLAACPFAAPHVNGLLSARSAKLGVTCALAAPCLDGLLSARSAKQGVPEATCTVTRHLEGLELPSKGSETGAWRVYSRALAPLRSGRHGDGEGIRKLPGGDGESTLYCCCTLSCPTMWLWMCGRGVCMCCCGCCWCC